MKTIIKTIAAATLTAGIALSAHTASAAPAVKHSLPTVTQSQQAKDGVQQVGYRYVYRCFWVRYGYRTYYRCAYRVVYW